jgi:hypothetical protein
MLGLGLGSLLGGLLSKRKAMPLLPLLAAIELLTGAFGLGFEQLQVHQSVRIRDAERLFAQRLLDLDAGNLGGGFIHVRIDERTDARGQRIAQIGDIGPLSRKIGRCRTERARGGGDRTDGGLGVRQHVGEVVRRHLAFYLVEILCGRREGRKRRHRGCGGR